MDKKIDESHADFCNLEREVVRILNAAMPQTGREATVMQSRFSAAGWYQIGGWLACCRILTVALLAALATTVMLATAFAASAPDAGVFAVPPPTGDPAADLAAIETAVATAKTWQARQPKGADGLAAKVEVVLAPGTYSLCPTGGTPPPQGGGGNYCLLFNNWENIVLRGTGHETRIVLLDPDEGYIDLFQSRHVMVADLTLDMATAPFTQGKVVAVHLNGVNLASLDVQLDPGFQTFADPIYQFDGGFLVVMDPAVARPKPSVPNFMRIVFAPPPYSVGTFALGVLLPDGKTWRLKYEPTGSPAWRFTDPQHPPIVPSDRFVFVTRRPNSGIMATFCDTVTLAHVTIHAAGGLTTGFVQNTGPLLVDDLDIRIPQGSPRLISTDADGAHFQNNRGAVTVRYSSFQGMADDAIVTYSLATRIHQVIAPGANGGVVDYSPRIIREGDRLQILDATNGAIRGIATVTQAQAFRCPPRIVLACYNLTLDAVPAGTMAQDLAYLYNAAGNGASIHHNIFHAHRGNGISLFAPDSSVADNEFTEVPNNGVTIGLNTAAFGLGPVPDHVVVRRNSFNGGDVGSVDILVTSVIAKSGVPGDQTNAVDGPSHIIMTDNHFRDPTYPAIDVAVGDHIHLSDDRIVSDIFAATRPSAPAVRLSAGSAITVSDLSVRAASGVTAAVEIGCGVTVTDVIPSRWSIRSGQLLPILDLRPQCP
jgi:hypothetical protein